MRRLDVDSETVPGGLDAPAIIGLLEAHYPAPEWATFAELRAGTGYSNDTRLDMFVLNTWPSKAFRSSAYEVKVTRSDFLREVRDPGKRAFAESIAHDCSFVAPAGLLRVDEVPEGWGLTEATRGGLRVVKVAQQRRPSPWPMHFIAALARRSGDPVPRVPRVAWTHAGHDLDEPALLAIAEAALHRSMEREKASLARDAERSYLESAAGTALLALKDAVRQVTGTYNPTAETFTAWAVQHHSMTPTLRAAVVALHRQLTTVLAQDKEAAE